MKSEGVHVVDATAILLRIANASPGETTADARASELTRRTEGLRRELLRLVDDWVSDSSEYLATGQLLEIAEVLEYCSLRQGIKALIAAQVLDEHLGHCFMDRFRAPQPPLSPGDPVPVVPFPSPGLCIEDRMMLLDGMGELTSLPARLTPMDDRTPRLRLAPEEVARFRVTLRWVDQYLEPIHLSTRFVAGVPCCTVQPGFQWDRYEEGSIGFFYGVTPCDPALQRERLRAVFREAVRQRASVLVLPELCLTEEMADELATDPWLKQIPLVALGSYHTSGKGPGSNRCRVLARGVQISVHEKFSDFSFEDEGVHRHEHLICDAERAGFELLLGAHSTAVVLICKDALDARVESLVRKLAPSLVMIPALSPKLDSFQKLAEQLGKDPQAFTLVCSFFQRGEAVLGRPVEGPAVHEVTDKTSCILIELKDCESIFN